MMTFTGIELFIIVICVLLCYNEIYKKALRKSAEMALDILERDNVIEVATDGKIFPKIPDTTIKALGLLVPIIIFLKEEHSNGNDNVLPILEKITNVIREEDANIHIPK